jgi:hypothetical protein
MTPVRPNGRRKILRFVCSKINELIRLEVPSPFAGHKCKPLAKRLGEMRRPANQSPQFMRFAPGEAQAALAGLDQ